MKKRYAALGAVGALTAVNMVRAARFTPKKEEHEILEKENVNVDRYRKHLSEAIRIKTVSHVNPDDTDWGEFDRFREFLNSEYPLTAKNLTLEIVGRSSLIYRWKGKDPTLDPIALLSHQDVVPLEEGTEDDWTHPGFDGFDDGE